MKPKHLLLALITVIAWGLNFIAIHVGLEDLPPMLLCAVRFILTAIPWVFFLPRPKAPFRLIAGYGIFTFAIQFGLLFGGIYLGLPAGLSSLVIQVQVFFSMGLAVLFFRDLPSTWKVFGALISFIGIGIVASHVDGDTTFIGLLMTLLSALSWAIGNVFSKKIAADSPLALVAWGSLVAAPVMMALSFFFEGSNVIITSLENISTNTILAVLYIVYLSSFVGYGIWGYLLNTYPTAVVTPFTLLLPVVGLVSTAFFLDEELSSWKLLACLFIMTGLIFNLLEKQIRSLILKKTSL
ncbi:EamA family transporter [Dyadobacter alkalitolerans]|uniref:EamA family transporter n=1 Tax=Dyadobacter alkalitolerans TaxID=492736 RepID=UPI00041D3FC6|nr:EamA family transporter [Dyadobacter alkalitolerans]